MREGRSAGAGSSWGTSCKGGSICTHLTGYQQLLMLQRSITCTHCCIRDRLLSTHAQALDCHIVGMQFCHCCKHTFGFCVCNLVCHCLPSGWLMTICPPGRVSSIAAASCWRGSCVLPSTALKNTQSKGPWHDFQRFETSMPLQCYASPQIWNMASTVPKESINRIVPR